MKQTLIALAVFALALPAAAQKAGTEAKPSPSEAAVKRCKENRGADCETREGLQEWRRQERPITEEERAAAAGARARRERCAKTPKGAAC